jgi:rfaE bifunctional protein kinase chain/domain
MQREKASGILDRIRGKKVLVIGDVMLDEYLWGRVERISPEAPVPVVKVEKQSFSLGGASNVALNVLSFGAIPHLVGIIGNDDAGRNLKSLMKREGMGTKGLFTDRKRATIVKKRIVAHHQQVVRVDIEEEQRMSKTMEERILRYINNPSLSFSAIVIEDYNKGLLSKKVIKKTISLAQKRKVPITVDPKFDHFFDFRGVTLFKPNIRELERVSGRSLKEKDSIERSVKNLQREIKAKAILLTMGERGMVLFEKGKKPFYLKPHALDVFDVTGAGDTVITAMTMALTAGCTMREATRFSSIAAAIEVTKLGAAPVTTEEIIQFCEQYE